MKMNWTHAINIVILMVSLARLPTRAKGKKSHSKYPGLCRDRADVFQPDAFRVSTCVMCLIYIFPKQKVFTQIPYHGMEILVKTVESIKPVTRSKDGANENAKKSYFERRDIENGFKQDNLTTGIFSSPTTMEDQLTLIKIFPDVKKDDTLQPVCEELSNENCHRWKQCCHAASECCEQQLQAQKKSRNSPATFPATVEEKSEHLDRHQRSFISAQPCPMTWDGFSCVAETQPETTARIPCPPYISTYQIDSEAHASRKCQANGTWWVSPISHMEWTDYSQCIPLDVESLKTEQIIGIACNCVSTALLLPAIVIFLGIRVLRKQQRICIHTSLLFTLLLTSVVSVLWERLVIYDLLTTPLTTSYVHSHSTSCTIINLVLRLTKSSVFFWMFCEGFHLHWLMVRSFKPIKSMALYFFVGWGLPLVLLVIYATVRVTSYQNEACWLNTTGPLEWLIDAPTIACISLNVVFLVTILRALLSQLIAHTDQVSTFKKAFRALLILIPLFGLHQFCLLYRPHTSDRGYTVYATISALVVNLQGAMVSLIFCFLNDEVQTQVKEYLERFRLEIQPNHHRRRQSTVDLSANTMSHRMSVSSLGLGTVNRVNSNHRNSLTFENTVHTTSDLDIRVAFQNGVIEEEEEEPHGEINDVIITISETPNGHS